MAISFARERRQHDAHSSAAGACVRHASEPSSLAVGALPLCWA